MFRILFFFLALAAGEEHAIYTCISLRLQFVGSMARILGLGNICGTSLPGS